MDRDEMKRFLREYVVSDQDSDMTAAQIIQAMLDEIPRLHPDEEKALTVWAARLHPSGVGEG